MKLPANGIGVDDEAGIAEFFENRSVFVTGATGFIGKILLEKLLRSCPGIKSVFVLARTKRLANPEHRVAELLKCKVFDRVRKMDPTALTKVRAVKGDLVEPNLGMSEDDEKCVINEVSVVFHAAATVSFDEPLKEAVAMNLHGTKCIIDLCAKIPQMAAFVHLSTAFVNCERSELLEQVYPPLQDPKKVLNAASWLSHAVMDDIYETTRGMKPNTYIYTKALAEALVQSKCQGYPTAIVRPSIVGPAMEQPLPGWIDSLNGPIALFLASGNGLLRSVHCDSDKRADLVPADYCVNLMIAAAWQVAVTSKKASPSEVLVFNLATGMENPMTWGEMLKLAMYISRKMYPFETTVMYPGLALTKSAVFHKVNTVVFQWLPAVLLDLLAQWTGRPAKLVKIQKKLVNLQEMLEFFCMREWDFKSKNVQALLNCLSDADASEFYFDVKRLNWREYLEAGILGCRTYYLGQDPSTIPDSIDHLSK
ncbi:unnamed protein product [Notodromas monacha]|uniref:Fatty acyl-CoA reductase n=1 Tax=Notodromas monacha TaxID=399045 RepID=A0A7R9BLW9_9CRUS|nr:unnamed protein product [Notodromas monacha]CAG0917905.1 unnamed protein product [Notodromas monacha]